MAALHCCSWWRWWSVTLWATLIKSRLHSLSLLFVEISLQFNRYLPNSGCMVFVVDVFQHDKWICSYGVMLAPSWTNACMVDSNGFSSFISLRIQKIKEHILECWQIWCKWAAMGGSSCRESQATGCPLDGPITGHCWSSTCPLWFTNSSVEHTILFHAWLYVSKVW
jgi:hypothetical protein